METSAAPRFCVVCGGSLSAPSGYVGIWSTVVADIRYRIGVQHRRLAVRHSIGAGMMENHVEKSAEQSRDDRSSLAALIERLENARGPDLRLDAAICQHIHPTARALWVALHARPYTASIDAALTLLPPRHGWIIDFMDPYEPDVAVGRHVCSRDHADPDPKSPAIMLCIAALKARGAQ